MLQYKGFWVDNPVYIYNSLHRPAGYEDISRSFVLAMTNITNANLTCHETMFVRYPFPGSFARGVLLPVSAPPLHFPGTMPCSSSTTCATVACVPPAKPSPPASPRAPQRAADRRPGAGRCRCRRSCHGYGSCWTRRPWAPWCLAWDSSTCVWQTICYNTTQYC